MGKLTRRLGWIGVSGRSAAVLALTIAVGLSFARPTIAAAQTEPGASVIYLVRHAEKAVDGDPADPLLSDEGTARAELIAHMLSDVPMTNVFSTPFQRTWLTAGPAAATHGLEVTDYDPRSREAMLGLVETLRTTPGHHLVVGHSNTTPDLVQALGGDRISDIDEEEYDRLYMVVIAPDGTVSSSLIRFGTPFHAMDHGERE